MEPTPRIQRLRESILLAQGEIKSNVESELLWGRSWLASAAEPWHIIRRGRPQPTLRGLTPERPGELLVANTVSRPPSKNAELEHYARMPARGQPGTRPAGAHVYRL